MHLPSIAALAGVAKRGETWRNVAKRGRNVAKRVRRGRGVAGTDVAAVTSSA